MLGIQMSQGLTQGTPLKGREILHERGEKMAFSPEKTPIILQRTWGGLWGVMPFNSDWHNTNEVQHG